jgi:hypothetical protein
MTRLVPALATATNRPFPYATEYQELASLAEVLAVQVIPSGEVMTRLVPENAIATNKPLP